MALTKGKKTEQAVRNGTFMYGVFQSGVNYDKDREKLLRLAKRYKKPQ